MTSSAVRTTSPACSWLLPILNLLIAFVVDVASSSQAAQGML